MGDSFGNGGNLASPASVTEGSNGFGGFDEFGGFSLRVATNFPAKAGDGTEMEKRAYITRTEAMQFPW